MRTYALLAAAAILTGCASAGTKVNDDSLSHFQKGVTTLADVEKALGPPQLTNKQSDGTESIAYIYSHTQAKARSFIPVVGLFAGGATGQSNMVKFNFDQKGKLTGYDASNFNTDVNTGIAGTSTQAK